MTLSRNQKKNINLKILHKVTYRKWICLTNHRWYNDEVALTSGGIFGGRR